MALSLISSNSAPPPPPMQVVVPPPLAAAEPPEVKVDFDWEGWSATAKIEQLSVQYSQFYIPQPDESLATLFGSPDDMDLAQANRLHIQASRWLEHIHTKLCRIERDYILLKGEGEWLLKTMKWKYKDKIDKATEKEFERLRSVEMLAVELEAELVVVRGIKSSLDKVLATASRTITRHTKSNPTFGA